MTSPAEWNTTPAASGAPVSVLERIISILDAVRDCDDGSTSITEIALRTGMAKSTVSRLVADLDRQRYLARTPSGVTLGLRLFELGARASIPRRLLAAAAPVIRNLRDATGERVGLWVQQGDDMVALATLAGRLPMLPSRPGTRSPALTTASGKAYLAFCADQSLIDRLSAPLVRNAADDFRHELDDVRSSVVAIDREVAYPGILAVASPVLAADHAVLGALSLAGPSSTMDAERLAPLVRAAGATLTRRLSAA
ncbi:DNA-binding IclR family transcriptional regulator [Microbacterium terrae]|uniref:Transcriptional regulator KdgR n=1 Tax=Microbacterium terrae TaxID=69369 RepID=A0A0M2H4K2_9MICO|nr:IclR family transcriptional regulator [Microbacterium terrae]KJL38667.1 Transcriptional regulator KdgR [Microbacterium terrae]MBP1076086.1 DNA-binding IclR family transcriptional regulator [Microbacterium terrae]GLJ96906.1 IclR family transcriptional regulator [Microbacterium terrae]